MGRLTKGIIALLAAIVIVGIFLQQSQKDQALISTVKHYRVASEKSFDGVVFDLEFAIGNENYNITSINRVGSVIAERHNINFPNYAIFSACNLEIAKQFLEIDPEYVTVMPCRIAVWEQYQKVHINVQLVPENDPRCAGLCAETNALLKRIVDFAAQE